MFRKYQTRNFTQIHFSSALTPFRGPQEPQETAVANENKTAKEIDLRRGFLTQLAYLCDYMAGGDTATAIGVQADPQIPHWEEGKYISWMAANAGCDNFEQGYIREWLEDCLFQKGPDLAQYKRDAEILREEILSKFINLATCLDGCRWSKNKGLLAPGESDIPAKKQPKRSSSHRISFYHSEAYQTGHLILNDMNHQSSPNHE